jgi:hypothetical protein
MKKIFAILFWSAVTGLVGCHPVPAAETVYPPASQTEVNAGITGKKFVSPLTLANKPGGGATNAVSTIRTNGVNVGTGITNLNFQQGANTTITGGVSGASVTIGISSTGGGSGSGTVSNAIVFTSGQPIAAQDNQGGVSSTNAAAFRDLIRSQRIFNVLDYGAVPNGGKYCETNIQLAIDAASLAGGGNVYLPAGTYTIGTDILYPSIVDVSAVPSALVILSNNVVLTGDGIGKSILLVNFTNVVGLRNLLMSRYATNVGFVGLTFDCKTNASIYNTFQFFTNYNCFTAGCEYKNSPSDAFEGDSFGHVSVVDCQFSGNKGNSISLVGYQDGSFIRGCFIDGGGTGDDSAYSTNLQNIGEQAAIQLRSPVSDKVLISDTTVINQRVAVQVQCRAQFANCLFTSTNTTGTNMYLNTGEATFANCRFQDASGGGYVAYIKSNFLANFNGCLFSGGSILYLDQCTNTTVANSTLNTSINYPIRIKGGARHIFAKNHFNAAAVSALRFTDGIQTVDSLIVGNHFLDGSVSFESGGRNNIVEDNFFDGSQLAFESTASSNLVSGNIFKIGITGLRIASAGNYIRGNVLNNIQYDGTFATIFENNIMQGTISGSDSQIATSTFLWNHRADGTDFVVTNSVIVIGGQLNITNRATGKVASITNGVFTGDGSGLTNLASTSLPLNVWKDDTTQIFLRDEFLGGANTSGQIGEMNWPAVGTFRAAKENTFPNVGVYHFVSGAVAGNVAGPYLMFDTQTGAENWPVASAGWSNVWIFKLVDTNAVFARIGFARYGAAPSDTNESGGVYLRFRDSTDGTVFKFVCRAAGAGPETVSNSVVAVNNAWHKLSIRSATAGTILFSLDGETEISIGSNVPGPSSSSAVIGTEAVGAKELRIDYFSLRAGGFNR